VTQTKQPPTNPGRFSPILIAAREHVRAGTAQYGALNVALTDDHSWQVKLALSEFTRMEPARQAQCWDPDRGTFDTFVTGHVRVAAAAICVFRRKPAGDSDPFQPVIPAEASH
jgi:hypothetical protein